MQKSISFVLLFCAVATFGWGQRTLEGLWQGTITKGGGLNETDSYKFELYLKKNGDFLEGRTYVYLENNEVIEMELSGRLYGDLSLYILEQKFIEVEGQKVRPPFKRKYQLKYKPSIWDTKMEGYWQEIRPDNWNKRRRLGRIELRKVEPPKRA